MLRFIFSVLFYGVLLGCIAILALWFFAGMTIQESFNWLSERIKAAPTVVTTEIKKTSDEVRKF